jgi:hypothetical protein
MSLIVLKIKPINTCWTGIKRLCLDVILISNDLINKNLKTKIIAIPAKLTSTTSVMKEVFGDNLSVMDITK